MNTNYMQVVEMTDEEKLKMYLKEPNRYMFNEKFILDLHTSFWKRLFVKHYTRKHLKEILSSFSL
jgi:hypothetical protein